MIQTQKLILRELFFEHKLLLKFSKNGDKVVALHSRVASRNKAFQLRRSEVSFYCQVLIVFDLSRRCLKQGMVKQLMREDKVFKSYYLDKREKCVDYLSDEQICVVFDDELLILSVNEEGSLLKRFSRINLISADVNSRFWGFYKDSYLFYRASPYNYDEVYRPQFIECLHKEAVRDCFEGAKRQVSRRDLENEEDSRRSDFQGKRC